MSNGNPYDNLKMAVQTPEQRRLMDEFLRPRQCPEVGDTQWQYRFRTFAESPWSAWTNRASEDDARLAVKWHQEQGHFAEMRQLREVSMKNVDADRDADDRAWVLSRFREWDSASLFPASDRPIAIRLAIRLLTLKEDEVEQPWNDVDRTLPPSGVFVETMRTGERLPNVCAWKWARIGTDVEWYERGKPGDPGRTTITHSTFVPPTHWRPIRTGSAS